MHNPTVRDADQRRGPRWSAEVVAGAKVVRNWGSLHTEHYSMEADVQMGIVTVRDRADGTLVAYSSSRADLEDSMHEFVHDYMI